VTPGDEPGGHPVHLVAGFLAAASGAARRTAIDCAYRRIVAGFRVS